MGVVREIFVIDLGGRSSILVTDMAPAVILSVVLHACVFVRSLS